MPLLLVVSSCSLRLDILLRPKRDQHTKYQSYYTERKKLERHGLTPRVNTDRKFDLAATEIIMRPKRRWINGKQSQDHLACFESTYEPSLQYKEQRNYDKAEQLLLETVKGRRLKLGDIHPHTLQSLNIFIDLYEIPNKPEEAEEWRVRLSQTEAARE
jgi:hypothetical protein